MFLEKLPERFELRAVTIIDSSLTQYTGRAAVREWTSKEAFWRGFRKTGKIVAVLLGLPLPFAFLDPFAFMAWGSVIIIGTLVFVGPHLHMKYWAESISFFYVEAECPSCHKAGKLMPYVSTEYKKEFTVICPACGETAKAYTQES